MFVCLVSVLTTVMCLTTAVRAGAVITVCECFRYFDWYNDSMCCWETTVTVTKTTEEEMWKSV